VKYSYNNIGYAYAAQGDAARALEAYQKALAIYRGALGERHPLVALDLSGPFHK
jgi:tetratricopeptide (TPR) repeat protein